MEAKLISLFGANDLVQLGSVTSRLSIDEISDLIKRKASSNSNDLTKVITALFAGFSHNPIKDNYMQKKLFLISEVMKALSNYDIQSKLAMDVISLLLIEMDELSSWCLIELTNEIINMLKDGNLKCFRFLELLAKTLSLLEPEDCLSIGDSEMNGVQFKSYTINNLCSINWTSQSVIHLTSAFKDITMATEDLNLVVSKIIKVMGVLNIQDVPPLVHQLLLLSAKGCRKQALDGVMEYFVDKKNGVNSCNNACVVESEMRMMMIEEEPSSSSSSQSSSSSSLLRQIEDTTAYHLVTAIVQNQEMGNEFFKCLKANQISRPHKLLSPFVVLLLMSLAKNNLFQERVVDLLKQNLTFCYKDHKKRQDSRWFCENTQKSFNIGQLVLKAVDRCLLSWENTMEGVVSFGFSLLQLQESKNNFAKSASINLPPLVTSLPEDKNTPALNMNILGMNILIRCSKVHVNVAMEISQQLINLLVTRPASSGCHRQYIDLLLPIISHSAHSFANDTSRFRSVFDFFAYVPWTTSTQLLSAMLPLIKISSALKNSLILLLRKTLFSRQVEMRKMSINGFMLLLKNFKVLNGFSSSQSQCSSSQVTADIHMDLRRNDRLDVDNKSLCVEVLNVLKRALTQQHDIRSTLYQGLHEVAMVNGSLVEPIIDLLFPQLKSYCEQSEAETTPPLKLASCLTLATDIWTILEPLPVLLASLTACLHRLSVEKKRNDHNFADDDGDHMIDDVNRCLDDVTRRLVKCDIEDLELESGGSVDASTTAGSKNVCLISLVAGSVEVLMQRIWLSSSDSRNMDLIVDAFQFYDKVVSLLKENQNNKNNKKPKKSNSFDYSKLTNHLSMEFVVKVLCSIFSTERDPNDDEDGHDDVIKVTKEIIPRLLSIANSSSTILTYFFTSAITKCQQILNEGHCQGYTSKDSERMYKDLSVLSSALMKHYMQCLRSKPRPNSTTNNPTNLTNPTSTDNINNNLNNSNINNNNHNMNNNNVINDFIKSKQVNSNCLKVFHNFLVVVTKRRPCKLNEYLTDLGLLDNKRPAKKLSSSSVKQADLNKNNNDDDVIVRYVQLLQRVFITLLTSAANEEGALQSTRDNQLIVQCISILIGCYHSSHGDQVKADWLAWHVRIFKEYTIGDTETLKLIFRQLLTLTRASGSTLNLFKEISRDVHACLGDLNPEVELEKTNSYCSVTVHSSLTITQLLLAGLDEEVDDLHWFIGHLKNKSEERIHDGDLPSTNHDEDATTNVTAASQRKRLPSLIQRVRSVVEVFHEIIQIAFSYGAIMNLITKSLVKFFNFLTSLVKLYIQNYGDSNGDDYTIGGRFEKLIQLIATKLTKSVYPMISYIETVENEHLQAANEKQKNKKNKNANAVDKIKSLKETKAIPNLIYSIEQFEKFLIQLTKKTKINLMCHFKLSTARDFRINSASLQAALDAEEEEEEEERDGDEENNNADNENIENDNGGSSVNEGDSINNNGNYGDNNGDKYGRGVPSAAAAAADGGDGCKETQPPSKRMKLKDVLPISNSKKSLKRK